MRNVPRLVMLLIFVFLPPMPSCLGQEPAPADPAQVWIAQLGAEDFRLREAASDALAKLGVAALEPIRAALSSTDNAEIARRLEAVLERLEALRLREPTRITWKVDRKPIKDVIQTVSDLAGCKVRFQETPEKLLLSFNWVETPLLQVLDQIGEAGDCCIVPIDDEVLRLVVVKNSTMLPLACNSGPFRISPFMVNLSRQLQIGGLPRNAPQRLLTESMTLHLRIDSEPKLPLVSIGNAVLYKAVDDRGQSLIELPQGDAPAQPTAEPEVLLPSHRTHSLFFAVALGRPHRQAESIKSLRGRITTCVLVEARPILAIENLAEAKGKKFDAGYYSVEVGPIVPGMPTSVELTIRRKGGTDDDATWMQMLYSRLSFYDADGSRLQYAGNQDARNTPNSTTALVQLQRTVGRNNNRPAKPTRLTFVEWITKQRVIEFDLKDIPLL